MGYLAINKPLPSFTVRMPIELLLTDIVLLKLTTSQAQRPALLALDAHQWTH